VEKTTRKFPTDGHESINILFGGGGGVKSSLECYRSLKEGLGTYASSFETVHW
jgi:hypothetical protein